MPAAKSTQKKTETVTTTETTTEPTKTTKNTQSKEPKETKATKTTTTKAGKASKTVTPPVVETVPEVENVVVQSDTTETSVSDIFTEFIAKFQGMLTQFSALKTELKTLEKKTIKQLKVVQKINKKKQRKGTRAPSGFVKPAPISNELAKFLGKPEGSEMARTDVTREINKYIRANNLQDKENGRKIIPDKQLSTLLKLDSDVVLTYFNLQRYMSTHFPKQTKSTEATTSA
jgi:chromatin remodeling complex protein RSC6